MKRVWKPLDVKDGYRLYRVVRSFPGHPEWNKTCIVAAFKPSHAAVLLKQSDQGANWIEEPVYMGFALNILMPATWWEGEPDAEIDIRRI